MSTENSLSKQRVLGFFDNEVSMYILKDIDRLTNEIRPDKDTGLRGCTVALAMMLFAIIACGALSGFHSIVASGTTSKQLPRESAAKKVASGPKPEASVRPGRTSSPAT